MTPELCRHDTDVAAMRAYAGVVAGLLGVAAEAEARGVLAG
jgi:hypothetical protein